MQSRPRGLQVFLRSWVAWSLSNADHFNPGRCTGTAILTVESQSLLLSLLIAYPAGKIKTGANRAVQTYCQVLRSALIFDLRVAEREIDQIGSFRGSRRSGVRQNWWRGRTTTSKYDIILQIKGNNIVSGLKDPRSSRFRGSTGGQAEQIDPVERLTQAEPSCTC